MGMNDGCGGTNPWLFKDVRFEKDRFEKVTFEDIYFEWPFTKPKPPNPQTPKSCPMSWINKSLSDSGSHSVGCSYDTDRQQLTLSSLYIGSRQECDSKRLHKIEKF